MYSVSDTLDHSNNFITLQGIKESEMIGNDQFVHKMEERAERYHICSIAQSSQPTDDIMSELLSCMCRNNNYKCKEFGNNNYKEMDAVDNRPNFETQHMVSSPLNCSDGEATVIGHMVGNELNRAGGESTENNNDQELEFKNSGKLFGVSRPPSLVQGNDKNNVFFEYCGKVEVEISSNENSGIMETEKIGTMNEIGTDFTNVINDTNLHSDSTSSCSDLNTGLAKTDTDNGIEILCGQNECTPSHFIVETFPLKHSFMHNIIPESENDIHSGKGKVGSYATITNPSTVDLEQFDISGKNCNPENHANQSRDIQGFMTVQVDLETAKPLKVHKESAMHVRSPIIVSLECASYGTTSKNKPASFPSDKFYCNGKKDTEVTKPAKNKKKKASIT
jgi:hypothetical protein